MKKTKGNGQIQGEDLSRPNVPSWIGLRKDNAVRLMKRDFAKRGELVRHGTAVRFARSAPSTWSIHTLAATLPTLAIAGANCRCSSSRPHTTATARPGPRHRHGR